MRRYVLRRLAVGVLQALGITIAVFFVIRALPADPVSRIVGMNPTPDSIRQARHALGLDMSLFQQLLTFLGFHGDGVFTGSLGKSWVSGATVLSEIATTLPTTIQLIVTSFIVALLIAIPIGMATARRPGGKLDKGVFGYGLFAGAQPEFWWGLIFIFVFYFKMGIAPAPLGMLDPELTAPDPVTNFVLIDSLIAGDFTSFKSALGHLILPVLTLSFLLVGPLLKMTQQSMSRVLSSEFILYQQASGLQKKTIGRSTLRSALAPIITLTGILFGFMLSGAVLVESVFSLNGLGQYSVAAVLNLDFPAVQGVILIISVISLFVYLGLDLLLAKIDPRILVK